MTDIDLIDVKEHLDILIDTLLTSIDTCIDRQFRADDILQHLMIFLVVVLIGSNVFFSFLSYSGQAILIYLPIALFSFIYGISLIKRYFKLKSNCRYDYRDLLRAVGEADAVVQAFMSNNNISPIHQMLIGVKMDVVKRRMRMIKRKI